MITPREAELSGPVPLLIFVRHGETDANVAGWIDHDTAGESLNARGCQQAQAVAAYLARDLRARRKRERANLSLALPSFLSG